jgi:hypothetical protein
MSSYILFFTLFPLPKCAINRPKTLTFQMVMHIWIFNPNAVLTNIVRFCDKTGIHRQVDQNDLIIGRKTK